MITSRQCYERFGDPTTEKWMVLFDVPAEMEIGAIPRRIYCHKYLVAPLKRAFLNLIQRGLVGELKTWDGCFNIRNKKSGRTPSLHSWGLAIDVNAAWNPFKGKPTLSPEFVKCFTDAGFSWGGNWKWSVDGMHFQLAEFPKE